eukprot:1002562-Prorocentrum_lima.AAC.1
MSTSVSAISSASSAQLCGGTDADCAAGGGAACETDGGPSSAEANTTVAQVVVNGAEALGGGSGPGV